MQTHTCLTAEQFVSNLGMKTLSSIYAGTHRLSACDYIYDLTVDEIAARYEDMEGYHIPEDTECLEQPWWANR